MSAARCTSPAASVRVLPSSRVSHSASSALRASRSCEVLLRMRPRAMGVVAAQAGKAAFAAAMAAAASSRPLAGYSATNSRLSAGLKFLKVWLVFAPTHSPAMKFWQVRVIILKLRGPIPPMRDEMNLIILHLLLQLRGAAELPPVIVRVADFAQIVQRLPRVAGLFVGHRKA